MARIFAPIHPPNDPRKCEPWLNNELRRISQALRHSSLGLAAITRGETPDGSGNPLPTPTLTDYWFKPGVASFGVAYGGVAAGDDVVISSTAHDTKGFIRFGFPDERVTIDETFGFLGVGEDAPAAFVHVNAQNAPATIVHPINDQPTTPNSWRRQDGTIGTTGSTVYADVLSDDSDLTYVTESGFSPGSELIETLWLTGNNPVSASHTVTVTIRHQRTAGQSGTERIRFVIVRGSTTVADYTRASQSAASPENYSVTLTPTEAAALIGTGDTTIDIFAVGIGAKSFDIFEVYLTLSTGVTAPIFRWDLVDVPSGRIDENGRLGVGTGSGTIGAQVRVTPTVATLIGQIIRAFTAQTADLLQFQSSAAAALSGFTAAGAYYLLSGAGTGKILTSDSGGVGSWASPSTLATRVQFDWRANGPYIVMTEMDGQLRIPTGFTITSVRLYRKTAGSSGSTIVDLNKNGTTMFTTQGNRPTVTAAGGNNQSSAGTLPDVTSVAAGDVLSIDIDQIEGGAPADFVLMIEGA